MSVGCQSFTDVTWHKIIYLNGIQISTRLSSRLSQSLRLVEVLDTVEPSSVPFPCKCTRISSTYATSFAFAEALSIVVDMLESLWVSFCLDMGLIFNRMYQDRNLADD